MKIYTVNGRKVWLDPAKVPAGAIPYDEPKKAEPVKAEEPEKKAAPVPTNKAKKATANKARKAGSNK